MKRVLIGLTALGLIIPGVSVAADHGAMQDHYVDGAFSDADDTWRRRTANRTKACGTYKAGKRRIDVLIDRYEAIGEAIKTDDAAATEVATKRFAKAMSANERFTECWEKIASKTNISDDFTKMVEKAS